MMRSMRVIVKPVFYVLAISFVAWLAIGQVTDILGGGKDVVLKVNGEVVRSQPFQLQYQAALEQYRRQQGGGRLSREDEQQIQNQVADQFIHNILLERAYRRLGITVSDEEIIRAARSGRPRRSCSRCCQRPRFRPTVSSTSPSGSATCRAPAPSSPARSSSCTATTCPSASCRST